MLAGQLNGWPWSPLPTAYWENPVSTNNREWAEISGDWTQPRYDRATDGTMYNPYSTAPKTPHIVWSRQTNLAAVPGGVWGSWPSTRLRRGTTSEDSASPLPSWSRGYLCPGLPVSSAHD